jgi:hypothetical protein
MNRMNLFVCSQGDSDTRVIHVRTLIIVIVIVRHVIWIEPTMYKLTEEGLLRRRLKAFTEYVSSYLSFAEQVNGLGPGIV